MLENADKCKIHFEIAENCGCARGATCLATRDRRMCGHYLDTNFARDVVIFSAHCLLKKKVAPIIASFNNPFQISVRSNSFGITNDYFKVFNNNNNFEVLLMKPILMKKQKELFSIQILLHFATNSLDQLVDLILI